MKVLLIGGTGLISTATTRALLETGASVTHLNRGKSQAEPPPGVQTLIGDRTDYAAFEAQMADAGTFDCVIDMVGYAPEDAESIVRAFRGRVGHFVFCSTVDVYARPVPAFPIREDAPLGGRNDYGRKKVMCENILAATHERGDFPVTILRPAQTYRDPSLIVFAFNGGTAWVGRLRKNRPILVHGDGQSLWCAAHAHDVGPAFAVAAGNPATFGKSYNVCGDQWLTWNDMYERAAQIIGAPPPRLVHVPTDFLVSVAPKTAAILAENFSHNNVFDNGAAHADLAYRYTIPFEEGFRRGLAWHDANHKIQDADQADPLHDYIVAVWERLTNQARQELTSVSAGR